jgi:hypothetical protein
MLGAARGFSILRKALATAPLAVTGSALHGDARPDSALDVLVEFELGHVPGLFRLTGMELELSALFGGRKVGLNTPLCLSRHFRAEVLAETEPVYAAARSPRAVAAHTGDWLDYDIIWSTITGPPAVNCRMGEDSLSRLNERSAAPKRSAHDSW